MAEYYTPHSPVQEQPSAAPPPPTVRPTPQRRKNSSNNNNLLSTLSVLLIAPLVALFLTAFVFQSYQVDGESMETTLSNNDRLLVWKVPKTWARITGHPYIPARGDVVVFVERELSSFGEGPDRQLIKRVIALPGERVIARDGQVTVYNDEHPEGFQPDKDLPYGKVITTTVGDVDLIVPRGKVYVMGDNRNNSLDSRSFGPVAADDIVGKLVVRVWPMGDAKIF